MQWNDEGFLLSKNNYGENSIIIEVFTLSHGKCPGIVYGGTSKKIKKHRINKQIKKLHNMFSKPHFLDMYFPQTASCKGVLMR